MMRMTTDDEELLQRESLGDNIYLNHTKRLRLSCRLLFGHGSERTRARPRDTAIRERVGNNDDDDMNYTSLVI